MVIGRSDQIGNTSCAVKGLYVRDNGVALKGKERTRESDIHTKENNNAQHGP